MNFKKVLAVMLHYTINSLIVFILGSIGGSLLGLIINFFGQNSSISMLILIVWSLWYGITAYYLLFDEYMPEGSGMLVYSLMYGAGSYLSLSMVGSNYAANIFAVMAILGLLLVITAPPFIAKYLKHKFIQRAR